MSLSFKPMLMEKVLSGEKTVTRRAWPTNYREDQVVSIVPGMGRISCGRVRILDVRGVRFDSILEPEEHLKEGFAGQFAFVSYWHELHGKIPADEELFARIEFELIETKRTICKCCDGIGTLAVANGEGKS